MIKNIHWPTCTDCLWLLQLLCTVLNLLILGSILGHTIVKWKIIYMGFFWESVYYVLITIIYYGKTWQSFNFLQSFILYVRTSAYNNPNGQNQLRFLIWSWMWWNHWWVDDGSLRPLSQRKCDFPETHLEMLVSGKWNRNAFDIDVLKHHVNIEHSCKFFWSLRPMRVIFSSNRTKE